MVRDIIRDQFFLRLPSRQATAADAAVADDLMDTLMANADRCVGMAANMIGESVRVIVFSDNGKYVEMFNPVITRKDGPFDWLFTESWGQQNAGTVGQDSESG